MADNGKAAPGKAPRLVPRLQRFAAVGLAAAGLGLGWFLLADSLGPPERLWHAAQADLAAKQFHRAWNHLERLARRRAPTVEDRILRAQVLIALEQIGPARAELAAVPDDSPFGSLARLQEGQLFLREHRARAAEAAFLKAAALNPGQYKARRELIYIYGMQSRWGPMRAQFEALDQIKPLPFDEVFLWSLARNLSWDALTVTETLRQFLQADPDDRASRLALAANYRDRGMVEEAQALLDALPADDQDALAIRARMAMDRGEIEEAARLLDTGATDHPELASLRGTLALFRKDGAEAVRQFTIADAADPGHRETLIGLARALELTGDEPAAARVRDRVRALDEAGTLLDRAAVKEGRDDPSLSRRLGTAFAALGRHAEARAWYRLAIERDPLDREAQAGLHALSERP